DNTALVQEAYAAFGRGDVAALLATCADDIVWVSNGDPAVIPWVGTRRGHAGVVEFLTGLGTNLDFEAFEPRKFVASGDMVVVIGFTQARLKSGKRGLLASEWVHLFTVHDGKLARFQEFYDTAAIEKLFR
ncbi:MAG: nuclear transport factor 2 family protein, partial [Alphaproteobacteria bacterium]|nr:nuclear transport factor 2 family protein [Alphaproteobacteria bacterium]